MDIGCGKCSRDEFHCAHRTQRAVTRAPLRDPRHLQVPRPAKNSRSPATPSRA